MAIATKEYKKAKPLPAPNSDFYQPVDVLTPDELSVVKKVRAYIETSAQPTFNKYWSGDAFPFELLPSFKELGIGGLGYEDYICAGGSQKLFGFAAMELARVETSFCTFFGMHSKRGGRGAAQLQPERCMERGHHRQPYPKVAV
jgi:hypothetical protein